MRSRMIKELRDRQTELDEPSPVEIAEDNTLLRFRLRGFDALHLLAEVAPCLAVVDDTIHPRPKLRVHRLVKFALPPKIKGKIGIELGEDDVRQQPRRGSFQQKRKLFRANLLAAGAADMAMRTDPRFDAILLRGGVRADDNGATGVVLGDLENDFGVPGKRTGLFVVDGEIHERSSRHRAAALGPKFFQLAVDLPDLDRQAR